MLFKFEGNKDSGMIEFIGFKVGLENLKFGLGLERDIVLRR